MNLYQGNEIAGTKSFAIEKSKQISFHPPKRFIRSKESVNKMDQFKQRISKMTTRDLAQEGISLLKQFKGPFKMGSMTRGEQDILATIKSQKIK